jgi:hypothetical protein
MDQGRVLAAPCSACAIAMPVRNRAIPVVCVGKREITPAFVLLALAKPLPRRVTLALYYR